ncbi:MAG: response regulator transcription factor [Actinobacteria bacterium]|nr:response regulator transcription factor [Actinomycetota bacterium]
MGHRVLVVEDNGALRFALRVMLEYEPYVDAVETVPSGEQALRVAPDLKPDVVVTDTGLPGLSGAEVAERLRSICPNARIISFSGADGPAPWADCKITKAGSNAIEDLRAAVSRGGHAAA